MKWWQYIICIVLVVFSIFCVFDFLKMYKAHSVSIGDGFNIDWSQPVETFEYSSTTISFSSEDNINYSSIIKLNPVQGFNGKENDYVLTFNESALSNIKMGTSSIYGEYHLDFINTEEEVACSTTLKIEVKFLATQTILTITCNDGPTAIEYWENYVKAFKMKVSMSEIKGVV